MRKYITLVLLLSFVGLLWAQYEDTCLPNKDIKYVQEHGSALSENFTSLRDCEHNAFSFQITPRTSLIYAQEDYTSEQDTVETRWSNRNTWALIGCLGAIIIALIIILPTIGYEDL